MSQPNPTPAPSWRDLYPVHPCADVFPMMSDAELDALGADITANGLLERVMACRVGPDGQTVVLDGRNRLAALERLGAKCPPLDSDDDNAAVLPDGSACRPLFRFIEMADDADCAAHVIAANIRRRHLTKEQQAELIVKTLEASTIDSANFARSFSPTPGKKGGSTKDVVLATAVEEAAKHGISKRTVENARAKIHGRTKKIGVSSTPPTSEARALTPPPPSTYEWVDRQLTDNAKLLDRVLRVYGELDVTAPKLTAAERRTVRERLTAARRRLDQAIIQFGGAPAKTSSPARATDRMAGARA